MPPSPFPNFPLYQFEAATKAGKKMIFDKEVVAKAKSSSSAKPGKGQSSQAKPSQAKPSEAKPSQAKLSQAKPS